ncbi:hypothetical protein [Aeoliella sp.]|uniref:hypothetical protein n=1 Tax=Aeoliella sp. TaxID=2795800 RepID=UPI003CCBE1B1
MKRLVTKNALLLAFAFSAMTSDADEISSAESKSQRRSKQSGTINVLDTVTYKNDSFGAYSSALDKGMYTAILFNSGNLDIFSKRLLENLRAPELAKYGSRLIVSFTDADFDKGAEQLVEALGVVRYPTLVVLKTNSNKLHIAGRIEGEVPVAEIDRVFRNATKEPIEREVFQTPNPADKEVGAHSDDSEFELYDQRPLELGPAVIDVQVFRNRSFEAYKQALQDGKHTAILFHAGGEDLFTPKMVNSLQSPLLAKYSNRLIVSVTNEKVDEGGKKLADAFKVVRYPTLVVLNTNRENLHVVGRIEGVIPVKEIDRVLSKSMKIKRSG